MELNWSDVAKDVKIARSVMLLTAFQLKLLAAKAHHYSLRNVNFADD